MAKGIDTKTLAILGIIGLVVYLFATGVIPFQAAPGVPGPTCDVDETTLRVSCVNSINGTSITTGATNDVRNQEDRRVKSTAIDAYVDEVGTDLPVFFSGSVVTGSDDGTDPDYYFVRTSTSWGCVGTYDYPTDVKITLEDETPAFTGKDDGTVETTWNITVGTTVVSTASLRIESSKGECIGNPDLNRPIAICVNGSTANLAKFNSIKPTTSGGTISAPQFMTAAGPVLECHILPTEALCDGAFYEFYLTIDPISDPSAGDLVDIVMLDKNLYLDVDDNKYYTGYEHEKTLTTNTDIGITAGGDIIKALNFN